MVELERVLGGGIIELSFPQQQVLDSPIETIRAMASFAVILRYLWISEDILEIWLACLHKKMWNEDRVQESMELGSFSMGMAKSFTGLEVTFFISS